VDHDHGGEYRGSTGDHDHDFAPRAQRVSRRVKVITFPATLACGSCGYGLHPESLELKAESVVVTCKRQGCPEDGIRYVFPGVVVELEPA
jgi:hypothetical protein